MIAAGKYCWSLQHRPLRAVEVPCISFIEFHNTFSREAMGVFTEFKGN